MKAAVRKIWYFTPYSLEKDLAKEINQYVSMVRNNEDYIVIMDGDIMFTAGNWGERVNKMIDANPEFDLLTCLATRISIPVQKLNGKMSTDTNLVNLHNVCEANFNRTETYKAMEVKVPIGGYFLCFKKKLAKEIPFISSSSGMLGVDGQWSKALISSGKKVGVCKKISIIHWYRLNKADYKDTTHLTSQKDCLMLSTVDNVLEITPFMRGIFPNKNHITINMPAGKPVVVPEYVLRYYTMNKPHVFKRVEPLEKKELAKGKMKILVTNNHLKNLAGSETFTYTLAVELQRQGHDVEVFTFHQGKVSKRLAGEGIPIRMGDLPSYDLILANHDTCVRAVSQKGFTIQTCHGIYPKLEQPSKDADLYVSISQEIANHLTDQGFKSKVIYNGVDCRRFYPKNPINEKVKTILSLSTSAKFNTKLARLCKLLNIKLITLNKFKNPQWNVEDFINMADLVISLGRGCYESLACGRPVLVLDDRQYLSEMGDGLILPENIDEIILYNCSGRRYKRRDTEKMLAEAIDNYDPKLSEFYRNFALENLNVEKQVQKYLALVPEEK